MQGMRGGEHLRAQQQKKPVAGGRASASTTAKETSARNAGVAHLRAQLPKEQLQGLPVEGGLVLASRTEERRHREGTPWCGSVTVGD